MRNNNNVSLPNFNQKKFKKNQLAILKPINKKHKRPKPYKIKRNYLNPNVNNIQSYTDKKFNYLKNTYEHYEPNRDYREDPTNSDL